MQSIEENVRAQQVLYCLCPQMYLVVTVIFGDTILRPDESGTPKKSNFHMATSIAGKIGSKKGRRGVLFVYASVAD
ncbi:MAG: hypothetical protein V4857_23885 [Pseudomonadota bacterium]